MDLHDLARNTTDGLHLAALAAGWIAVVAGLGGLRDHGDMLRFAPRLPEAFGGVRFRVRYRHRRLRVTVTPSEARYDLVEGDPLVITHHGHEMHLATGRLASCPIRPARPVGAAPEQPPGRAPKRPARG